MLINYYKFIYKGQNKNMLIDFTQQLRGTLNITFFILLIYLLLGDRILSNIWWRLGLALLVGSIIAYIQYISTATLANNLQFEPEGPDKVTFDAALRACELDPESVRIRYGFSQGSIALSMLNTISLDPMVWQESTDHTSIQKARETINTYIMPTVPSEQKELLDFIKATMTQASQNFIFKHELGHTIQHYSIKKIVLTGLVMATAVFLGASVVTYLMPVTGGLLAAIFGATIGSITDLILSAASNLFKYYHEKEADRFAIRYSNPAEIEAAAQLFEKHQEFLDLTMSKLDRFYVVTKYVSGNFDGKERAAFLRNFISAKN
jgi:uncharacterized oligopeptide transporter (OPT) family protein